MNTLPRSVPNCPPLLQAKVAHAARFAHAIGAIHEDDATDEAALLWLEGRADEVGTFTREVMRAWACDELTMDAAARTIDEYLHALHVTLEGWFGSWYAPTCCGPVSSPSPSPSPSASLISRRSPESGVRFTRASGRDPLADTLADYPDLEETDERVPAPIALACAYAEASRRSLRIGGVTLIAPRTA